MELNWKTPFTIRKRGTFFSLYDITFEESVVFTTNNKSLANQLVTLATSAYNLGYVAAYSDSNRNINKELKDLMQ